ncbi:MAG: AMP-binding protein [Gammaproteobacteria bacterium]|nr:AMP-binding protein [Gammaproteobacteria bacterium]
MTSPADKPAFAPVTVVELLRMRAQCQPNDLAYRFLIDGENKAASLSYKELDRKARAIAILLQNETAVGDRALMLYAPGLEYISAFFGCLYAGILAVPVYPPRRNRPDRRIREIVADAQPATVLTTREFLSGMAHRLAHVPELAHLHRLASDDADEERAGQWKPPAVCGDTPAFLQYTSGSTGTPKGTIVCHDSLLYNQRMIKQAFGHTEKSDFAGWLPLYHDMGLIGNVLQPLYLGVPCTLMSPVSFLQKPFRWLQAISRYRAATSGGPNFAYDLCVKRITPEQRAGLDLSCWEVAFNGAEPVSAATLDRFTAAFAPCGFRREAFYPCYGMAEATLFVSGGNNITAPAVQKAESAALAQNQVTVYKETDMAGENRRPPAGKENRESKKTSYDERNYKEIVSCGHAWLEEKIVIADPETRRLAGRDRIGEIWVSGLNIASGYWGHPEETTEIFQAYLADSGEGPFLRTGDLGFLQNGELFVTGRLKDLIIIRGRNHYPQDIEFTAEQSHPAILRSAAFSVEVKGEERLVVIAELARRFRPDPRSAHEKIPDKAEVFSKLRETISDQHELQVHAAALLKIGAIPMTSSGKIRHRACREHFLTGRLNTVAEWRQPLTDAQVPENNEAGVPLEANSQTAEAIQAYLLTELSAQLNVAVEDIDVQEPLARYGLDSAAAAGIAGQLEEMLGCRLSAALLYDYPSVASLVRYLTGNSQQQNTPLPLTETENRERTTVNTQEKAIAVIGAACRFPGAENPKNFWKLLRNGVDATSESSRWDKDAYYSSTPAAPGKMSSRRGGFLAREQIEGFDADFFGISPREAETMDPQQRLLLELAWEALENAGQNISQDAGQGLNRDSGVFIGISNNDYAQRFSHIANIDAWSSPGNAFSIAANRLSYQLDLHGPSMAIDTACSSSLAAVHQACQSLRLGECRLALAGGVNLILSPHLSIAFSQARMLAADGRCKTFDAGADGYARGEGGGIVVLKRLSEALEDEDNILAVIKGTAINQNGRGNGLMAPNGFAQQAVIRRALQDAGAAPADISYIEAFGAGTPLGDSIEMNALKQVLLPNRDAGQTCWIGSVKTNIGHLEAAAGIAGFIKTALSLQHGEIFPHLHLKKLNPDIELENTPLAVPTQRLAWPDTKKPRMAGVSSFGFGGANAHVILEEAPPPSPLSQSKSVPAHLLTLSAANTQALRELAQRYADYLKNSPHTSLENLCFTANTGRAQCKHRLAATAESGLQLREQLQAFAAGRTGRTGQKNPGLISGLAPNRDRAKIAFIFTGQGRVNAGRLLYDTQADFRKILEHCDELLRPVLEKPLLEILYPNPSQNALFALEYALTELWRSWGIVPDAVMGGGAGEYAAACAAGVFSLEDACKLIAAPSRIEQTAKEIAFSAPKIAMISSVTGKSVSDEISTPAYWHRHEILPEDGFAAGMETLGRLGCELFVETGPGQDDWRLLLEKLGQLYVHGVPVNWPGFEKNYCRQRISLPTYPFQRQRYWVDDNRDDRASSEQHTDILQRIKKAPANEHQALLNVYLQERVAAALKQDASRIDVQQSLNTMGLDSLMAMELRDRIKTDLGAEVAIMKFMEGISIAGMAAQLNASLADIPENTQKIARPDKDEKTESAGETLAKLDHLTDEEVNALLDTMLPETK